MWTLDELSRHANTVAALINGRWVAARPMRCTCLGCLFGRLKEALAVARGRADAFTWPEGQ